MAPGRSAWISDILRPRSLTRRIPSSRSRAPQAAAAVYSPRLCPATKSGVRPSVARNLRERHADREQGGLDDLGLS